MFDRLKAAMGGGGPSAELTKLLRPMEVISPDLFARTLKYVHDGSNAEVLAELDRARDPQLAAVLLQPGAATYVVMDQALEEKLSKAGFGKYPTERLGKHRKAYYTSKASVAELARLGRLYACLTASSQRTIPGVPTWFMLLINDVLTAAEHGRPAKQLPDWTVDRVVAIGREAVWRTMSWAWSSSGRWLRPQRATAATTRGWTSLERTPS